MTLGTDRQVHGPFTEYTLVTTPEGVYGVQEGQVMWLEPRRVYDKAEGREIELWTPVYERVVDEPGPLPYTQIAPPPGRQPYLDNYATGIPYETPGTSSIDKLTDAIMALVAQNQGQPISVDQATASAINLVATSTSDVEQLTEAVEAMRVEETDDGDKEGDQGDGGGGDGGT